MKKEKILKNSQYNDQNNNEYLVTPYNFLKYFFSDDEINNFIKIFENKTIFLIYSPLFRDLLNYLNAKNIKITKIEKLNNIYSVNNKLFFSKYNLGSSAALEILEICSFYRFSNIIQIGFAGSFDENINIGDIFISEGAFSDSIIPNIYYNIPIFYNGKDEYFFINNFFESNKDLSLYFFEKLYNFEEKNKNKINIFKGIHYSTDFVFKETIKKFNKLREKNAKIVEMEGATFFGFCKTKNIKSTGIYIISDKIDFIKKEWIQKWNSEELKNSFYFLIQFLTNYNLNLSI